MALRARRAGANGLDAWPGYVDALSTLLMVVMFVLLVFVLAQALESVVLAKRNDQLTATNQSLTMERERNTRLNKNLTAGDAARQALLGAAAGVDELLYEVVWREVAAPAATAREIRAGEANGRAAS